ncbi:MAG: zinc metallopeptidase [Acutalibacteraceae bacterium]
MWWMYFDPLYITFMIPVLILVFGAQFMVKSRYKKYSRIPNSRGMTGAEMARYILNANGLSDVEVRFVNGELSDNYNPAARTVSLSSGVYNSTSAAAIGIAAHECGHAVQHAVGYFPIKIRSAIIPVCNFGATLSVPIMILGAILNMDPLIYAGLILFGLVSVFQFITLPVEFNASRRALQTIKNSNMFNEEDISGARSVLTAAAMTYVAAFAQSVVLLLYYFVRFTGNRRK